MHGYQTNRKRKKQQQKIIRLIAILGIGCITLGIAAYLLIRPNKNVDSPAPTQTPEVTISPVTPSDDLSKNTQPTNTQPTSFSTVSPTVTPTVSPTLKPVASTTLSINKALFDDAVFIGDSRTEGLQLATGLSNATFLTHRGLTVSSAMSEKVILLKNGKKGTIIDALSQKQYKQIFIMFGVNELGWPYTKTFEEKYMDLLNEIKKVQPNAKIYVQSIIPVTKEKSDSSDIYNNKNIKKFNQSIVNVTKQMGLTYLDVQQAVVDKNNILPADATPDGVHLNNSYCKKWLSFIEQSIH